MRILWVSDAGRSTGFSRVTHAIGERLARDYGHEVSALAVGWDARNPVTSPMRLYRAEAGNARNYLGFDRVVDVLEQVKPDVVVTLEDPPILRNRLFANPYDRERLLAKLPVVAYLPVDGYNLPTDWDALFQPNVHPVAMSEHGRTELQKIGAPAMPVAYHGVDPADFYPVSEERPIFIDGEILISRAECRAYFDLDPDAFIVGRVDTNSGRKDWPATWRVMDLAIRERPEIQALWHTKLHEVGQTNLNAFICKGPGKYIVTGGGDWPTARLAALINSFSITLSTSRGEGFGLGLLESIACGVPVIASRHSAVTEVVGPGGVLVEPEPAFFASPHGVEQRLADSRQMARELVALAADPERLASLGEAALEHSRQFRWEPAAACFENLIASLAGSAGTVTTA